MPLKLDCSSSNRSSSTRGAVESDAEGDYKAAAAAQMFRALKAPLPDS